jgi:nitrite reductase/ring-hydroxylating ferredoxin subunit
VRVVLANFPALAALNGAAYLIVATAPPGIVPVVLTRTGTAEFAALSSECTHPGCVLQPSSSGPGVIQCNCHGSQYTAQGVVVRGRAARNLRAYAVRRLNAPTLEVEIPEMGFARAGAVVSGGAEAGRLRLTFATVSRLRYGVRQRATLGSTEGAASSFSSFVNRRADEVTHFVCNAFLSEAG